MGSGEAGLRRGAGVPRLQEGRQGKAQSQDGRCDGAGEEDGSH